MGRLLPLEIEEMMMAHCLEASKSKIVLCTHVRKYDFEDLPYGLEDEIP